MCFVCVVPWLLRVEAIHHDDKCTCIHGHPSVPIVRLFCLVPCYHCYLGRGPRTMAGEAARSGIYYEHRS